VTYTFYRRGDCTTGMEVTTQMVTINSNGTVPISSPPQGPLTAADGPYAFKAVYSGDANFVPGSSDCEPFAVSQAEADPSTTVFDASTNAPVTHILPLGAMVYDTTKLTTRGFTPTGTVTYTFFHSSDCTVSTAAGTETVTIVDGTIPNSSVHGPLGSGSYAFVAHYPGDGNYVAGSSACEPLSVDKAPLGFATTVFDATTNQPVSSTLPSGATVFDTAKLTTTSGITPTGTVTYAFFSSGTCITGTLIATETVTIGADGSVPSSRIQGPLTTGGPYSFEAEYSSDANFLGTGSGCEPLDVSAPAVSPAAPSAPASAQPSGLLPLTGLATSLYAVVVTALFGAGIGLVRLSRRKSARGRHFTRQA
jgi:hypothetical protein